jgi:glycosyltransferase involved in cell wall biosynthesis
MKVLHVIPSVSPLRGGPSVILRTMVQGQVQAGLAVEVVTTDDHGEGRLNVPHAKPILEEGVIYRYFPRQTRFYTFSWPLTRWLAQHVKDYDLINIHYLFSYPAIPAAYWAKRWKVPYIVHPFGVLNRWGIHNRRPWMKKFSYQVIERRILKGAAAVRYESEQERSEAAELGVRTKCVVIPEATEVPLSWSNLAYGTSHTQHSDCSAHTTILFLSRLDRKKGLDILLPAFAELLAQHPKAILVIAGGGNETLTAELKQKASRLRISAGIRWPGFLKGEDKWAAFAGADIFVLPSYSESFGMAVLEAMAAGLPVVVSDQVPLHQEITAANAGIVVPCGAKELSNALLTLVKDARLRARMGGNGRCLVQTKFSPEAARDRMITLYRETCSPVVERAPVCIRV